MFKFTITLNAVLALAAGIAFALYGPLMLAFFGVPEIPEENVLLYWHVASFARLFGAALFGFGLILWAVRGYAETGPAEGRRGLAFALLLANAMGAFVATTQQFAIWETASGLILMAIFALFTLAYAIVLGKGFERSSEAANSPS